MSVEIRYLEDTHEQYVVIKPTKEIVTYGTGRVTVGPLSFPADRAEVAAEMERNYWRMVRSLEAYDFILKRESLEQENVIAEKAHGAYMKAVKDWVQIPSWKSCENKHGWRAAVEAIRGELGSS